MSSVSTKGQPRKRRFDVTLFVGLGIAIGFIVLGHVVEGGSVSSLAQGAAALIVFGGTCGAVIVSFGAAEVLRAVRSLRQLVVDEERPAEELLASVSRFAMKARKEGIVSLEDDVDRTDDPFLKRGLSLAVDGTNSTLLRSMLEAENMSAFDRDEAPARVFESAGGYAPTIGILGAVMGLIHVMENLSDPARLGSGIAVAFVATVYGVGSANLLFLPIGTKLRARAARLAQRREVQIEGILGIQEGLNPRLIDQKLRGLLGVADTSPSRRLKGRAA